MRDRAGSGFNVFFVDPFSPEPHTLVRLLISQVGPVKFLCTSWNMRNSLTNLWGINWVLEKMGVP